MAMINTAKFKAEADSVNKHLGRIFASSLEPILKELGTGATVFADASKTARLQELIFQVPADRQVKYAKAFDVLKAAGLAIGGRPTDPSMHFLRFDEGEYNYSGIGPGGTSQHVILSPGSLHHVFDFKWKSSTGSMASLAQVSTREDVRFRTPQGGPPFNNLMPTDMQFYWGTTLGAASGWGRDDHSMKPPALMAASPMVAGENIAEQWYQYSVDGTNWHNIPGAAYLLTKGIRQSNSGWAFYFRKSNWAPHNNKKYLFEAEYPITPLTLQPKLGQVFAKTNGTVSGIAKFGKVISSG